MERYHIFKLGWAITFYAAYCIRPMLVYSLDADNELDNNRNIPNAENEYFQYFQGVEGKPGRDYPVYSYIPRTSFNCRGIESGYYADLETDCQVFHICEEGRKISFLCPNGTIFQQSDLICEWWNKVNCTNSPNLYEESAERLQNDISRRKSSRRVVLLNGGEMDHGAVMRMEERTSVRATKNGKQYPVRQQTQQTHRIKNHRIPDNNNIEQQIEEAESNNRHLANAQNSVTLSQRNNLDDQNQRYPNHNYNVENSDDIKTDINGNNPSSRKKQTKKDIDRETGNFINRNYDQASSRQSKKFEQGSKNDFKFGTKTGQNKGTTLKEYHVEFGSTSSGIDSSTNSYSTSRKSDVFTATRSLNQENFSSSDYKQYQSKDFVTTYGVSSSHSTESIAPENRYQETSSAAPTTYNNPVVFVDKNVNKASSSLYLNYASSTELPRYSTKIPQTTEQRYTTNAKTNRGSVKYNSNPIYFNGQQTQEQHSKNQKISTPVTTYSPPRNYAGIKVSADSQLSLLDTNKAPPQDNYDIPFPKHKSELLNDPSSIENRQDQTDVSASSTESSRQPNLNKNKLSPNQQSLDTSQGKIENGYFNNQESDETQVPQESSSFVKSSFNSITDNSFKTSSSPYPNHRSTYSDIKDIGYLEAPKIAAISSINAHLVTTQPINNGKPFVGSRVGTTLIPNQSTTPSKYTYLPTSTDSSKPTVIFGVIRHSSTTEPPPYGPPELFNLGNSDKTIPTIETTTLVTNPLPTDSFNIGSTESTIKSNIVSGFGTSTIKPLELHVPEHGSLNVGPGQAKTRQNFLEDFNLGTNEPNSHSDRFNIGNTDKTRPTVETTTSVTNSVPTETFNVGNTDTTIKPNVVAGFGTSTIEPLNIHVPEHGSLNVGRDEPIVSNDYEGQEPVNEPPFIKKSASLLYSNENIPVSTQRTVDHATVYGTYVSTTKRPFASSNNTPYSPTVPTVTQSISQVSASSPRTPKAFNQGVPIRFENGQDKISIQLSKNLGGQTQTKESTKYGNGVRKVNAVVHVGDVQSFESSTTKDFNSEEPNVYSTPKSKIEKPRPFARLPGIEERLNTDDGTASQNSLGSTFPAYQISSARPFGISQTTSSTPFITTQTPPSFNVYDNVDSMMNVLQEIANFNALKENSEESRPGLVIPPSVGPQTLHSLAQYFANELQNNDPDKEVLKPETKEKLTSLLTAMTVHGYNNLFNIGSTATPTAATSSKGEDNGNISTRSEQSEESSEENNSVTEQNESTQKGDSTSSDDDLLTTTSLPELRQLARNFSLALSSYLHDPDNFKKSLEGLRPTEPPALDGSDNVESSTTEDELLNFSDADIKPTKSPAIPSPTWGYILASESQKGTQDDVKNSLNPDLNTADSQSFVPRFNNLQVDEKQQKGFTDLPPNHWTSSPQATKLWQKALSVNPAVVNEHFETTSSIVTSAEEETTEPELFNQEILPELKEPHSQISYDLRELPPLSLNSTQVHGILIDFMNHTKSDEHNRLNRILKQLNTSEEEFLNRMKEIESNPLTKRLVLLLISECGANITQDLGLSGLTHYQGNLSQNDETLSAQESSAIEASRKVESGNRENQSLGQLVHPHLREEDQDARALQLLNSLYSIASKFGKKR